MKMSVFWFLPLIFAKAAVAGEAICVKGEAHSPQTECAQRVPGAFTFKGHFRYQTENLNQTDYSTRRSVSYLRLRTDLQYEVNPKATVFLQPQAVKAFGEPLYFGTSTTGNSRLETSGQTVDTAILFHQAYGAYRFTPRLRVTAGRQVLSYGDELIIGGLDWNNVSRSFDAIRARYGVGPGWIDAFVSQLDDRNISTSGGGDKNFKGLYTSWNLGPGLQALDVYGLHLRDATPTPSVNLWTFGLRVKSTLGKLDYRGEAGKQTGSGNGYQVNGELGHSFGRVRIAGEYFQANASYQQLFPTAHKFLGYADVVGRRNLRGAGLHGSAKVAEPLSVQLDYYRFRRMDPAVSAYKKGGAPLGSASGSVSRDLGSELDLTVTAIVDSQLSITGGASVFFSGNYMKDQFGDVDPKFYFLQALLRF